MRGKFSTGEIKRIECGDSAEIWGFRGLMLFWILVWFGRLCCGAVMGRGVEYQELGGMRTRLPGQRFPHGSTGRGDFLLWCFCRLCLVVHAGVDCEECGLMDGGDWDVLCLYYCR